MPKLWKDTIDEHRRDVRGAIMAATWDLASEHGVLSVTMSSIAGRTGIGRATLYKYFPDVESILKAHHEQHVETHLEHLVRLRDESVEPRARLVSVVEAYANMSYHRGMHGTNELSALLHRGEQVVQAQRRLVELFDALLTDAVRAGVVRDDVPVAELAAYCLSALSTATDLDSTAAVRRLIALTMAGLALGGEQA